MNIPRQFGKIVLSVISIAALMIFLTPQFVFAGEKTETAKRYIELEEVNFEPNPDANARIRISKQIWHEDHPNNSGFEFHTTWDISVTGLHCLGNHQQPDGHAEWTRQASYALHINGLRLLTFNEGCPQVSPFGDYRTIIQVFVPLPFDPFADDLVAEVVPENDDGMGTCDSIYPCDHALLRGEDIIAP